MRVKSSKRNRMVTVRPARSALRMRRVTRSTTPIKAASMSWAVFGRHPIAFCDPIDRRRLPAPIELLRRSELIEALSELQEITD